MTSPDIMKDKPFDDFLLTQSVFEPFGLIVLYLVLVTKIGPNFMKNREPMQLKPGFPDLKSVSILCTITSRDSFSIVTLHHKYVLLKLFDFLETGIFILRKKDKQVSFLHVFHHIGVFLMSWIGLKYSPGGPNYLSACINCLVHAIMYCYYLQSMWTNQKHQWWKKYITVLQVGGNSFILLNYVIHLLNPFCSFPKWILVINLVYMLVILYLFGVFYKKSYVKSEIVFAADASLIPTFSSFSLWRTGTNTN
ncbi:very long chain fatty acid elongase 4-like [Zophobas morio]|uniref:very long chain fatty acid elongase 4-like n=1 Tax=Zophobas morio TaxID=2755281 RepID=UPI0030826D0A